VIERGEGVFVYDDARNRYLEGVSGLWSIAALALRDLDPDHFLGGRIKLDFAAAETVIDRSVGAPLGWSTAEAAAAILDLATERMVGAIENVMVSRGVDPAGAVLVGGGGSAGFNVVAIARRLGCGRVVIRVQARP